jgi:hypothetical protein
MKAYQHVSETRHQLQVSDQLQAALTLGSRKQSVAYREAGSEGATAGVDSVAKEKTPPIGET